VDGYESLVGNFSFSQHDAIASANGKTLDIIRRIAPTIERAQHL
jgi:hypothetical protein